MHVQASILIERPADEVFDFATGWDSAREWQVGVDESVQTSPGPIVVGTTFRHRSRFMGRPVEVTGVVIGYDPPRVFAYQTSGSFSYVGRQTFEAEGTATRATYLFEADLPGVLRLVRPLAASMARRRIEGDYRRLKALLEARAVPTTG